MMRLLCRQAPAEGETGGGSAGTEVAKTVNSEASETLPAGVPVGTDGNMDGTTPQSMLRDGAGGLDGQAAGKATTNKPENEAAGQGAVDPIKIVLPEKLPDGVTVDQDFIGRFEEWAGKNGYTSDEANALVGWYIEQQGVAAEQSVRALREWSDQQYDQLTKDPDFGGQKLAASKAAVQRAVHRFGKAYGLSERLESLGLQNDPAIIKTLAAIGKALGEDHGRVDNREANPLSTQDERNDKLFPSHVELRKRIQ
jgi:hypothetical protein